MESKEKCSEELIDMLINEISKAPDSQIDDEAREMLKNCNGTYAEKYDTIVKISKMDLTKISSFVKVICELDKHYIRPE